MKYAPFTRLVALFVIITASFTNNAIASNVEGGNISYLHISDSTYQFFYKLYVDCSGVQPPASVNMCIFNNCTNQRFTQVMPKWTGTGGSGQEIPLACSTADTKCTNSSSTYPGVRTYWYSAILTLPITCNSWKFSVVTTGRNTSNNLAAADFFTETVFNNTVSHANSSPIFVVDPIYNTCLNAITNINCGAVDADGDSLHTTLIQPLSSAQCSTTATGITFKTLSPALSVPGNPLQTGNTFTLNGATGAMNFKPTANGKNHLSVRVNEYRNGALIGSSMRDIAVFTYACNTTTPSPTFTPVLNSISGAVWNNGVLYGCIGQQLQFCFDIKSSDPNAVLHVSEDIAQRFPGATVTYSAPGDSVRGCMTWTPTAQSGGKRYIHLSIKNHECSPLPLLQHHVRSFAVSLYPVVKTINDTAICPNESAVLQTTGGTGNYTWSILSGTPASLSCTNCPAPVATPVMQTTYVVSAQNALCPNNANYNDTVTVKIHTAPVTTPTVTTSVTPGTTVTVDSPATFTAAVTGCTNTIYIWQKNGSDIAGAVNSTWTTSSLNDGDIITCKVTCADTCPQPRVVTSSPITMTVLASVRETSVMQDIKLYPNPNKGSFTIRGINNSVKDPVSVQILNMYGQVVYKTRLTPANNSINMGNVPPGIYILKAGSTGKTHVVKFTVQ